MEATARRRPSASEIKRVAHKTVAEWLANDIDCCEYPFPYDDEDELGALLRKQMELIVDALEAKGRIR